MITTLAPSHYENEVLVGHGGMLFLGGGGAEVREHVEGRKQVPEESWRNLATNLQLRQAWVASSGATYLHLITPDKQSIVPHMWPGTSVQRLGDLAIDRFGPEMPFLRYHLQCLASWPEQSVSIVDTHYTDFGAINLATAVASDLIGSNQTEIRDYLISRLTNVKRHAGDLGSKLSPQVTAEERVFCNETPGRTVSNNMPFVNNGIVDIYLNPCAPQSKRLAVFGDSFGRHLCVFLRFWFREVMFFRTPWFHPEIAELYKPHFVVTQNVERYLVSIPSDSRRRHFLLLPYLKGYSYSPPLEFVELLSALLSVGRDEYDDLVQREFGGTT